MMNTNQLVYNLETWQVHSKLERTFIRFYNNAILKMHWCQQV